VSLVYQQGRQFQLQLWYWLQSCGHCYNRHLCRSVSGHYILSISITSIADILDSWVVSLVTLTSVELCDVCCLTLSVCLSVRINDRQISNQISHSYLKSNDLNYVVKSQITIFFEILNLQKANLSLNSKSSTITPRPCRDGHSVYNLPGTLTG